MTVYLLFLIVTGLKFRFGETTTAATQATQNVAQCSDLGDEIVNVHIGWPFKLDCRSVAFKMWTRRSALHNGTCTLLRKNGTEIFRVSSGFRNFIFGENQYPFIDLREEKEFLIELNISAIGLCGRLKIQVNETNSNAENYNCSTLPKVINVQPTVGEDFFFHCVASALGQEVKLHANSSELTYEWWYNCSRRLPQNVQRVSDEPDKLKISQTAFINGGEYTCAIRYKNLRRFVARFSLCVKESGAIATTIKCPKKVKAESGSNVNITCQVDQGIGSGSLFPPAVTWYSGTKTDRNNSLCHFWMADFRLSVNRGRVVEDKKIRCENFQSSTALSKKCFMYQPPPDVETVEKRKYDLNLMIKNFQLSDAGVYTVKFHSINGEYVQNIEVIQDETDELIMKTAATGIGASAFVLLILVIIVCYWKRTVCCKKCSQPRQKVKDEDKEKL